MIIIPLQTETKEQIMFSTLVPHSQQVAAELTVCLPNQHEFLTGTSLTGSLFLIYFPFPYKFILNSSARLILLKCYFHWFYSSI